MVREKKKNLIESYLLALLQVEGGGVALWLLVMV